MKAVEHIEHSDIAFVNLNKRNWYSEVEKLRGLSLRTLFIIMPNTLSKKESDKLEDFKSSQAQVLLWRYKGDLIEV